MENSPKIAPDFWTVDPKAKDWPREDRFIVDDEHECEYWCSCRVGSTASDHLEKLILSGKLDGEDVRQVRAAFIKFNENEEAEKHENRC